MTTGLRINRAADDPAGFYIASKLGVQINGLSTANTNMQSALNILGAADDSLEGISKVLGEIKKLIEESCNDYMTPSERETNQKKINELFAQALKMKNESEVDGQKVFGGVVKLDKNATYTDGKVTVAAGQVLNRLGDRPASTTGATVTTGENLETGADEGAVGEVEPAATSADDGVAVAAYNPEDEGVAVAAYDGEEEQVAAYSGEETATEPTTETEIVEESVAAPMMMSAAPRMMSAAPASTNNDGVATASLDGAEGQVAAYSGEETVGEDVETEYVVGENTPLDGETDVAPTSLVSNDNGVATAAAVDWSNPIDLGTSGTYDLAAGASAVVKINGKTYLLENTSTSQTNTLTYSTSSGVITLAHDGISATDTINVTALDGSEQADNINFNINDGTLNTGDGNDTVTFNSSYGVLNTGDGADSVTVTAGGSYSTIVLGAGDDKIENSGYWSNIDAGDGNDSVVNSGRYSTIALGAGDDTVENSETNVTILKGTDTTDTDSITTTQVGTIIVDEWFIQDFAASAEDTISIGGKTYTVENKSTSQTQTLKYGIDSATGQISFVGSSFGITAADANGADNINFNINYGTLNTGDGNDAVTVSASYGVVDTGAGADSVTVTAGGYGSTIALGAGDDTINNSGYKANIDAGDGNDIVTVSASYGVVDTGDGADSVTVTSGGRYSTIALGAGDDTATNSALNVTVDGGDDNDSVVNSGYYSTIALGAGDDTIDNSGFYANIDAGDGNDSVVNSGSYSTIALWAGDDTLNNFTTLVIADGGADNDIYYTTQTGTFTNFETSIDWASPTDLGTSGTYDLAAGASAVVKINGKTYLLENTNTSEANTLTYSTDANGVITLTHEGTSATDTINVTALDGSNQADNINFNIKYGTLKTGDGNDTVTVSASYGVVDTGVGADSVTVTAGGRYSTITLGAGNDTINNSGSGANIDAGDGNDSVVNNSGALFSTIVLGAGDDTINNSATYTNIDAGDGNDSVVNSGRYSTIGLGTGSDTVSNTVSDVTIKQVTDGTDSITKGSATLKTFDNTISFNAGESQTVELDGKTYTITNNSASSLPNILYYKVESGVITFDGSYFDVTALDGSNQADNINFNIRYGTLNTGDGNDSVVNSGNYSTIALGAGDDTINNSADRANIDAGDGNDTVTVSASYGVVDTGDGADSVTVTAGGRYSTIALGAGDDTINNSGAYANIDAGDGNDTIDNLGSWANIDAGDGNDSVVNSGSSSTIALGAGNDTIDNSGNYANIDAGDGNDSVVNRGTYSTIALGAGDDTIENSATRVVIDKSGDTTGTDSITSTEPGTIIVDELFTQDFAAGAQDTISIGGKSYTVKNNETSAQTLKYGIDSTTGQISFIGSYFGITASDSNGADNINFAGEGGTLNTGDGNDSVVNNSGSSWSTIALGAGDDTISNLAVRANIDTGEGNDSVVNSGSYSTIALGAGDDTLNNTGSDVTADGGANNDIYYTTQTGTFINFETSIDWTSPTDLGTSGTYNLAAGASVVVKINGKTYLLENTSTSAANTLTYSTDANGVITLTHEGTSATDTINVTALDGSNQADNINFNIKYGTLNTGDGNDTVTVSASYGVVDTGVGADSVTVTAGGLYSTIALGAGDDTIDNSADRANIDAGEGNDSVANDGRHSTIALGAGDDTVENSETHVVIDKSGDATGNDSITTTQVDTIIVDEWLTQDFAVGAQDTISIGGKSYTVKNNGTFAAQTLKYGIDSATGQITFLGEDFSITAADSNGADNIHFAVRFGELNTGDGNDSVISDELSSTIVLGAGDDTIDNSGQAANIDAGEGNDSVVNNSGSSWSTIALGAGDDTIDNSGAAVNIDAGEGNDSVVNTSKSYDSTIALGVGDDTLNNFAAFVTADGGADNDIYYSSETGTFTNFETQSDTEIVPPPVATPSGTITATSTTQTIYVQAGDKVMKYDVRAFSDTGTLNWSYDEATDKITFQSDSATGALAITAHSGQADNVILDGGDLILYTGDGNDSIVVNKAFAIDAGDDDDCIDNQGVIFMNATLGAGNDTFYNYGTVHGTVFGNDGNDLVENKGYVSWHIDTGYGDDTITLASGATAGYVSDYGGTDTLYWDSENSTYGYVLGIENIVDTSAPVATPSGTITATSTMQTIYVQAGDKVMKYDVRAFSDTGTLNWSYDDATDKITFQSSDSNEIIIIANSAQNDKVVLDGKNLTFNGADEDDTITIINASWAYGGAGNDVITIASASSSVGGVQGDTGDDTITIESGASIGIVYGGDGYAYTDSGTDTLYWDSVNSTYGSVSGIENVVDTYESTATPSGSVGLTTEIQTIYVQAGDKVMKYDVHLHSGSTSILNWSYDSTTGKITFQSDSASKILITAHSGQEDNVILNGQGLGIYAGDEDDTIFVQNKAWTVYGDVGNDSITILEDAIVSQMVYGGDWVNVSDGNDTITLESGASVKDIDGDGGTDYLYWNSANSTYGSVSGIENIVDTNAPVATPSGSITVRTETQTILVQTKDGVMKYDVYGDVYSVDTLSWSYDEATDKITFQSDSENTIYITAHSGQEDKVILNGDEIKFFAGDGDDIIDVQNAYVVDGGADDDTITIKGEIEGVNAGEGNDSVVVEQGAVVYASMGNVNGNDTFIIAGAVQGDFHYFSTGNDSIIVKSTGKLNGDLYLGYGNDTITTEYGASLGSHIYFEEGNDVFINYANINSTIAMGNGDDIVQALGNSNIQTIFGGNYNSDTSTNDTLIWGANASVGGYGIDNAKDAVSAGTISGVENIEDEDGNDLLNKSEGKVDINHTIDNPYDLTIEDKEYEISGEGELAYSYNSSTGEITFTSTDGLTITSKGEQNDNIIFDVDNGTLNTGAGDDTVKNIADNATINTGDGKDSVINDGNNANINTGADNDKVINNKPDATIDTGEGDDTVDNNEGGSGSNIITGGGKDSVDNKADDTIIDTGNDDDLIDNSGNNSSVAAGAGNDTINDSGDGSNIDGGDGEDNITSDGEDVEITPDVNDNVFDKNTNTTTVSIGAGATKTVEIDGLKYDVKNNDTGASATLVYSVTDGQIKFASESNLTITAHASQNDNVLVDGASITFNSGDLDDTITVQNAYAVLGESGNDSITVYGSVGNGVDGGSDNDTIIIAANASLGASLHGGQGNDIINFAGSAHSIYGDEGDDSITIESTATTGFVNGEEGNDTIVTEQYSSVSCMTGGSGDDVIRHNGYSKWHINGDDTGAHGNDTIYNNGFIGTVVMGGTDDADTAVDDVLYIGANSSISSNVTGIEKIVAMDNSGFFNLAAGDSVIFEIDGLKYTVKNNDIETKELKFEMVDGQLLFESDGRFAITAHDGQEDNVSLDGRYISFDAGDLDDTITVYNSSGVYSESGNDVINIVSGANVEFVDGGDDNDIITVEMNASAERIIAGTGDDTVTVNGIVEEYVSGDAGNDNIYIYSDNNTIYGGDDDDMIFIYSDGNTSNGGDGNDSTTIKGSNNMAYGGDAGYDKVATTGSNNSYTQMNELTNGSREMNIQTDWTFSDTSQTKLDISAFLPSDYKFDISSNERATEALKQLEEIMQSINSSRAKISVQNNVLENYIKYNTAKISNLENSLSVIQDADTAAEYNKLIAQASLIEQLQTIQAQISTNHYNIVSRLISRIAG